MRNILGQRPPILDRNLAGASRPFDRRSLIARCRELHERRKALQIRRWLPWTVAGETTAAILDVGRVADFCHLAIADDIDPAGNLLTHDVVDSLFRSGIELRIADRLAGFTCNQRLIA